MTAPESLGMSATPSTDSALSEATTEPNISIFIFIYFFIYKRLQTKSHQKMSTPVNVELSQFVAHNVPRVLRALSDAMARISHLLSDAQVETFQVRSSDAVRAANQTSANAPPPVVMTMMGPAAAAPTGPPPVVTVPVLSATLELRGTSFELDARLVDRKARHERAADATRHHWSFAALGELVEMLSSGARGTQRRGRAFG
jgi:hypothetical protein